MKNLFVFFFVAILILLIGSQVNAGDITGSITIRKSGTYNVTQNFTGYIEVKANSVIIIGNGYKIFRNSNFRPVIAIDRSRNVKVSDLKIRGGNSGVIAHYCKNLHLESVEITASIGYALNMFLSNVDSSKIVNCQIFGGMYGINAENFDANLVEGNSINSNIGIYIQSGKGNFGTGNVDRYGNQIQVDQPEGNFININKKLPKVNASVGFEMAQNYPNPFNPKTRISYSIAKDGQVNLAIYNILGQKVAVLVDEHQLANTYEANFDASDLTSGVYFCRLEIGSFSKTMKMLLNR